MIKKFITLIFISLGLGFLSRGVGLNLYQAVAISIFSMSILGTLFFWDFRLSFAFLGVSILLIFKVIDLENFIKFSSLEVILFLVGMMVLIGLLKDAGVFAWIVGWILRIRNLTARKFVIFISLISAGLACAVDEVTSIVFIVAAVFEICDYFEVNPTPFLIISVLATNVGSGGTALGNPIGILIASKSGLTFEDFIINALPLTIVCLVLIIILVFFWFRKEIKQLDANIKNLGANDVLINLISVPPDKDLKISLVVFGITLFFIALHHRLEVLWNLPANTLLLIIPLISSGCVMIWKYRKARIYIEKNVEWWTLLFFLFLFSQAGALKYSGATDVLAQKLVAWTKNSPFLLITVILWISAIGSSVLDNVVLVAVFIPIIQSLGISRIDNLWWALLFGGCLGGNITLIGSTANIVALGILEKEKNIRVSFMQWFKVGLVSSVIVISVVWVWLIFISRP